MTGAPMPKPRVMVDIETLGREPGTPVLSIGAVLFDRTEMHATFYRSIDRATCESVGLDDVDPDTLDWWERQPEAAQDVLTGGEPLSGVLADFSKFYGAAEEIWANSPSFDCEILECAYDAVNREPPWEFYEERDFRTLKNFPIAPDIEQEGVEHNALDDAKHQTRVAMATLREIYSRDAV